MSSLSSSFSPLISSSDTTQSSFSSWISEKPLSWFQRLCIYILKWGSLPKHVAIVMDGNRRYAKKQSVEKIQGHQKGFGKLTETLQWCSDMDIMEVTIFAFSIENFKRTREEIDALMELARQKFRLMIEEWKKLRDHGICVRVIGNLALLPKDLISLIIIATLLTKDNKRTFLNIAFSYTGKDEVLSTSSEIINGIRDGKIRENEITETFFDQCLYTYESPPPDLLIRTSGEFRISDFLTWQSWNNQIYFVKSLWPEFSMWNLLFAIFCYQHFLGKFMKTYEDRYFNGSANSVKFADTLQKERWRILVDRCCSNGMKLDYQTLESLSAEEVYVYYKKHYDT
ncbi:hypothetical protein PGB90_004286 [Kerria lacca]